MVSGAGVPTGAEGRMHEYVTYFFDLEFGFSAVVMVVFIVVDINCIKLTILTILSI